MKKLYTKCFLLLTIVFLAVFALSSLEKEKERWMGCRIVTKQEADSLQQDRRLLKENLKDIVFFHGASLPFEEETGALYLSQSLAGDWKGQFTTAGLEGELYIVEDAWLTEKEKAIEGGHAFKMLYVEDDAYTEGWLVCTGLPVLSMSVDMEAGGEDAAEGEEVELYLFNPDDYDGSTYTVTNSGARIETWQNSTGLYEMDYRIRLYKEDGTKNEVTMLDMDKNDDWELHAIKGMEDIEKEKLSADLWKEICHNGDGYSAYFQQVEYVEVLKDGKYQGIYLLCEHLDRASLVLSPEDTLEDTDMLEAYRAEIGAMEEEQENYRQNVSSLQESRQLLLDKAEAGTITAEELEEYDVIQTELLDNQGKFLENAEALEERYEVLDNFGDISLNMDNLMDFLLYKNFARYHNNVTLDSYTLSIQRGGGYKEGFHIPKKWKADWETDWQQEDLERIAEWSLKELLEELHKSYVAWGINGAEGFASETEEGLWVQLTERMHMLRNTVMNKETIETFKKEYEDTLLSSGAVARYQRLIESDADKKASGQLPVISLEIDETLGTLEEMYYYKNSRCYGNITIEVPEGYQSEYTKKEQTSFSSELEFLKGHGNTSFYLTDKKSFKFKLDRKSDLFGMGRNKDWLLISNSYDPTLLRNKLAYDFAERIGMAFSPQSVYVNLEINGKDLGCYLLTEQIRVAEDRLDIGKTAPEAEPEDKAFLLEVVPESRMADEETYISTEIEDKQIEIVYPKKEHQTEQDYTYITEYLNHLESLLYGENSQGQTEDGRDAEDKGSVQKSSLSQISQLVDLPSAVNSFWVQEFFKNADYSYASTFFYKDDTGKLYFGPVWDFDTAAGEYKLGGTENPEGWYVKNSLYYDALFKDEDFRQAVVERYGEIRKEMLWTIAGQDGQMSRMEGYIMELGDERERNLALCGLPDNEEYIFFDSLEESDAYLEQWLLDRIQWFDENIAELAQ